MPRGGEAGGGGGGRAAGLSRRSWSGGRGTWSSEPGPGSMRIPHPRGQAKAPRSPRPANPRRLPSPELVVDDPSPFFSQRTGLQSLCYSKIVYVRQRKFKRWLKNVQGHRPPQSRDGTHVWEFSFLQLHKKRKAELSILVQRFRASLHLRVSLPISVLVSLVQDKEANKKGFSCLICREVRPRYKFRLYPRETRSSLHRDENKMLSNISMFKNNSD